MNAKYMDDENVTLPLNSKKQVAASIPYNVILEMLCYSKIKTETSTNSTVKNLCFINLPNICVKMEIKNYFQLERHEYENTVHCCSVNKNARLLF